MLISMLIIILGMKRKI